MFEVIISQVKSGRIERKFFDTRSEAEQHLARKQDQLLSRRRSASLRDYRMEICLRPALEVRQMPQLREKTQAA